MEESKKRCRPKLSKVRTGCLTCRKRRVKCDEARPACTNCSKRAVDCAGYPRPFANQRSFCIIVPKVLQRNTMIRGVAAGPIFDSGDEGRYYRYYCEEVAGKIAGPFRTLLWERLIPQIANIAKSIRHSVIALGALCKSRESAPNGKSHYQNALIQHGKALRGMQAALESKVHDLRTAHISSFLVFCFESMAGRQSSASLHACSAVQFIHSWATNGGAHRPGSPKALSKKSIDKESAGQNVHEMHPSSCAQRFHIEEDIHSAYSSLDLQGLLTVDNRPVQFHRQLVDSMTESVKTMPSQFVDLKDCHAFLQLITRRNFHFISVARWEIPSLNSLAESASISADMLKSFHQQRNRFKSDVKLWRLSSATLFERACVPGNSSEGFIATSLLRMHALWNSMELDHAILPPAEQSQLSLSDFRAIVRLSSLSYPHLVSHTSLMFSFAPIIIPALSQVAKLCRDYKVRHQALDLLLKPPEYVEGAWNSRIAGSVALAFVNAEEEWIDGNGNIPDNRRASILRVNFLADQHKAILILKQRLGTDLVEDVIEREVEARW